MFVRYTTGLEVLDKQLLASMASPDRYFHQPIVVLNPNAEKHRGKRIRGELNAETEKRLPSCIDNRVSC
ncbi:hypothetical protein CDV36_016637 [Fusarium kuroshium]|uniref:Uncharacterized protein n=1 Tax=Fusarium kuroshium TaxID=2010991 RepID=A0A3M2QL36_9HYPO|nr:hypothetical protein CDV36_016637 [Fusarium kuroshium]